MCYAPAAKGTDQKFVHQIGRGCSHSLGSESHMHGLRIKSQRAINACKCCTWARPHVCRHLSLQCTAYVSRTQHSCCCCGVCKLCRRFAVCQRNAVYTSTILDEAFKCSKKYYAALRHMHYLATDGRVLRHMAVRVVASAELRMPGSACLLQPSCKLQTGKTVFSPS